MNKCYLYYSFLSSVVFASACLVFSCMYGNVQGGIWAGIAALVSGLCFYLIKLYFANSLQYYFRAVTMDKFHVLGFIISLLAGTFGIWYLFTLVYWKIPLFDYVRTPVFPCVFSFIAGKWGFHLYVISNQCKEFLSSNYSPLVQ